MPYCAAQTMHCFGPEATCQTQFKVLTCLTPAIPYATIHAGWEGIFVIGGFGFLIVLSGFYSFQFIIFIDSEQN